MNKNTENHRRITLLCKTAILAAVTVVLSAVEAAVPDLPMLLPGMKLGLSNIAIILGLNTIGLIPTIALAVVKSGFVLITRGAAAAYMSISGGVLSLLAMYLCIKIKRPAFGSIGIGITGAFFHNMGQLAAASFIIGGAVFGYGAVLCFISVVTGSLTGLCSGLILRAVPFDRLR